MNPGCILNLMCPGFIKKEENMKVIATADNLYLFTTERLEDELRLSRAYFGRALMIGDPVKSIEQLKFSKQLQDEIERRKQKIWNGLRDPHEV